MMFRRNIVLKLTNLELKSINIYTKDKQLACKIQYILIGIRTKKLQNGKFVRAFIRKNYKESPEKDKFKQIA
jgi:hypothetical protein